MKTKSRSDSAIVAAIRSGWSASFSGEILNAEGVKQNEFYVNGYAKVHIPARVTGGRHISVLTHRFVCAFHYGTYVLECECIRHLDGNQKNNNVANLAAGTLAQNQQDIPKAKRLKRGNNPNRILSYVTTIRKLSDVDILSMREMRKQTGASYAALGKTFGVGRVAAWRSCNNVSWKQVA